MSDFAAIIYNGSAVPSYASGQTEVGVKAPLIATLLKSDVKTEVLEPIGSFQPMYMYIETCATSPYTYVLVHTFGSSPYILLVKKCH